MWRKILNVAICSAGGATGVWLHGAATSEIVWAGFLVGMGAIFMWFSEAIDKEAVKDGMA